MRGQAIVGRDVLKILQTLQITEKGRTLTAQQIYFSFCQMFPFLLLLHIKRTKLCKSRLPHTGSLCDVNMSGQV